MLALFGISSSRKGFLIGEFPTSAPAGERELMRNLPPLFFSLPRQTSAIRALKGFVPSFLPFPTYRRTKIN